MALMAVTMTAGAQRNDLYSSGKNSGKSSSQSTQGSAVVTRTPSYTEPEVTYQQAAPVVKTTPQIIVDRDPDEYNRRYTYGTSQIQYEDGSILDDVPTVYIHDTIYVIDPESGEKRYVYDDDGSYAEGYNDAVEDYYLTRRLYRFRHYGRFYMTPGTMIPGIMTPGTMAVGITLRGIMIPTITMDRFITTQARSW